ncbi:class D sortase [Bacillus sp. YZJH907-2]|uniref:Class D sortase n=2 Tax=Halalkalibacter suaedae TaxID=2822140 RepID=A0A941ASV7_9BACI|nr:class D sortase [Bacillus suaedae]MBP3950084.1 class D sortase [Bacillus suaedae]
MKRFILLCICSLLIVGGLWFSTSNLYTFLKGYLIYKTYDVTNEIEIDDTGSFDDQVNTKLIKNEIDSPYPEIPEKGDLMGELYIPRLEATLPIYHGTDEDELEKGVGHYAGSVLPGIDDNSVLSGHRDTVFRRLGEVGLNDLLIVKTATGEYTYKVRKVRIVDADDRTVIVPKPTATLTVSTCYPFNFVGSAPERYVLIAELIEKAS